MYDAGDSLHYFIDEPAMLSNGKMVIPVRWLEDEMRQVWADAWEVRRDERTVSSLIQKEMIGISHGCS